MAKLKVSAEEAGESMEHVEDSLRKLQGVTGESKDNIEALANLLQADFKGETLDTVVENLAGAVVRFPETLKIESLADSLQETVATGKGVGQFAELLERCGVDIDSFNARMEAAGGTAARQNIVMQTLANTGLAESYAAYVQNNQALVEAGEASFDYEQAMNDLAGTLEPARFAVLQTISDFIEENGETLEQWGQIILFVVSTIVEMLEMLASLPPSVTIIITTIILAITIFTKVNKAINDGTGANRAAGGRVPRGKSVADADGDDRNDGRCGGVAAGVSAGCFDRGRGACQLHDGRICKALAEYGKHSFLGGQHSKESGQAERVCARHGFGSAGAVPRR